MIHNPLFNHDLVGDFNHLEKYESQGYPIYIYINISWKINMFETTNQMIVGYTLSINYYQP